MKKVLALLFAALLLLSAAGCGKKATETTAAPQAADKPEATAALSDVMDATKVQQETKVDEAVKYKKAITIALDANISSLDVHTNSSATNDYINIEGTHYQVNADGMAEYLPGQNANTCTYHLGSAISNVNSIRWNTENPEYAKLLIDSNSNSQKSVALGFAFNTENVTNEITQLDNVCAKYQIGLESGAMDPETVLPEFIKALKDAGIEKVIAEKQAQLNAFLGK